MSDVVSIPRALHDLAIERCGEAALIVDQGVMSWEELDLRSSQAAGVFAQVGVVSGDLIAIASENSHDFFISIFAAYKVGAIPLPISGHLTLRERIQILELAVPRVVVGFANADLEPLGVAALPGNWCQHQLSADPHRPEYFKTVSPSWKAPTSGGSTGRPKIIVATDGAAIDRAGTAGMSMRNHGKVCIPGPMYHNAPFSYAIRALAFGNTLVTSGRRFNAATTLQMLEESSAYWLLVVPTMMHRIWREPTRLHFELQSLEYVWHVGAKCPEWLKESWIQWLGAERVFELYAGTEAQAITCLRGDEWLSHRGSVGRPVAGEISIRDEKSRSMPPGSMGEIFMRPNPGRRTYSYIGARPKAIEGGWESLGDLGYVDESGYLYITDRLSDMIVTGGANVYPAEVEAALEALNDVESAVVVGVPDEDLGLVVSAVVQVRSGSLTTGDSLARQLTENLAKFKIPRQWVLGTTALRDDAGKTRRSTFRELFTNENFERTKL